MGREGGLISQLVKRRMRSKERKGKFWSEEKVMKREGSREENKGRRKDAGGR